MPKLQLEKKEEEQPFVLTADSLLARIRELQQQREQTIANLNAIGGAIQDCQWWLQRISQPAKSDKPDLTDPAAGSSIAPTAPKAPKATKAPDAGGQP